MDDEQKAYFGSPLGDKLDLANDLKAWERRCQNGELKEAINQFLWQNGDPRWQLYQAEQFAVMIYRIIVYNSEV